MLIFISGFFTGAAALLLLFYYIGHRQQAKREHALKEFQTAMKDLNTVMAGIFDRHWLQAKLQHALETENFEEAARIRDLINKQ